MRVDKVVDDRLVRRIDSLELDAHPHAPIAPRDLALRIDVALGAASYTATIMALWNLVGRPQGPERAFMNRVNSGLTLLGRSA